MTTDSSSTDESTERRLRVPVPGFIKRRYSAKFVVSILLVVVVIGATGAAGYDQVQETIERDTIENLESSVTLQADTLATWMRGTSDTTVSISRSDALWQEDESQITAYLEDQRRNHEAVTEAHYFDANSGEVIASSHSPYDEEVETIDEIDDPWANASIASELNHDRGVWVSPTSYDHSSLDQRVIAFASRTTADPDRIVVVEATLELRVGQLHQPGVNYTTSIVNENGDVVLSPYAEDEENLSFDIDREIAGNVSTAGSRAGANAVPGDQEVKAYAAVPGTDLVAVSVVPTEDAFVVRDAVGMTLLSVVGAAIISLGIVGVVLGRQTIPPLTRLRRQTERMEEGDLDVDLETDRVDEIGQLYGAFDRMRNSLRDRIDEVEAARDRADRMNSHLEAKATEYSEVMQACASGDYTTRMDAESESEAMAEIATEFNEMIAEIEATTEQLKQFATDVATASEQVTASTEEVRAASLQVTESVQAISDGADRQNESLQAVDSEMSGLSSTVEEIASSSNEVADVAERTAETGEEGREAADAALDGMDAIHAESTRAVEEIEALEAEIDRIDELVEFIGDVSEQTNMLALNANIEAARSDTGDGSGFGVVAGEVKELAAETKSAAEDIESLIGEIKAQTHRTAAEVQETSDQIETHRSAVENAASSLEEIARFAQETNDGVQDISAATEQQAASTQEVVAMVDETAAIAEETSTEAENVAAAAEEQTSSLTEVSQSIVDLASKAATLSTELDEFETDAGRADTERDASSRRP